MTGLLFIILIVVADQGIKYAVISNIAVGDTVPLIPGVFSLTQVQNYGAAFGLLQNHRWVFLAATAVFLVAAAALLVTKTIKPRVQRWALIVVLSGAVSNAIDRIIFTYVVDMFQFEFVNFAVFNFADICIVLGGIVFCVHLIFFDSKSGKKPLAPASGAREVPERRETSELQETPEAQKMPEPQEAPETETSMGGADIKTAHREPEEKKTPPDAVPSEAPPEPKLEDILKEFGNHPDDIL